MMLDQVRLEWWVDWQLQLEFLVRQEWIRQVWELVPFWPE
jgi:hypothetical protein